jgi:cytokinesis protein
MVAIIFCSCWVSLDGMVSQLKANIYSLEDLLRLSRHTIQTLQAKLNDVEIQTQKKLAVQDAQLKHLLKSLQDSNALMTDAGTSLVVAGKDSINYPMIDKEKLRRLIEQTKLEGSVLQQRYGNHLPDLLTLPDPDLDKDIERAGGFKYEGPAAKLPAELLASIASVGKAMANGKGEKSLKQGKNSLYADRDV